MLGAQTTYTYDLNSRMVKEAKVEGSKRTNTLYTYDPNGNIITSNVQTQVPVSAAAADFTGLANGENNLSGVTINEYDGLNQLVKVTQNDQIASYTYNAEGLRNSKTVNGILEKHIWDGAVLIAEDFASTGNTNFYLYGNGLVSSYSGANSQERYFQTNAHGDVTALTDPSGLVVKRYAYDAYGNEESPDPSDTNPMRYSGEYFDKETGSIYLRARYYAPTIGRFISEDSYPGVESDPLSLNLYVYVGNNPVNFFDPDGHDAILITNSESAFKQGHTSAVYQDSKGDWYYTYWGDKAAAVIGIPDKYIVSQNQDGNVTTTFTADSMTS